MRPNIVSRFSEMSIAYISTSVPASAVVSPTPTQVVSQVTTTPGLPVGAAGSDNAATSALLSSSALPTGFNRPLAGVGGNGSGSIPPSVELPE